MKDWTGNKNSVYKTLGASNHTDKERQNEDFYATEPKAAKLLLELETFSQNIWECACGEGHLSKVFEKALEIIPKGNKVAMFLKIQFLEGKGRKKLFLSNPPKTVYVSSSRLLCAKNAEFEKMIEGGGSAVAYAWYVWQKGFNGTTELKWFN